MDLTVDIPDEAVPALRVKASGVTLEAFAEQVLLKQIQDEGVPVTTEATPPERRTGQELIDACAKVHGLLTDEEVDTLFRRNPSFCPPHRFRMSAFLLDTNIPSELVRPQPEPKVRTWVAAQSLDTLFISSVSFGELRKGIFLRSPGKRRAELEAWIETDLSILFSGRIPSVTRSIAEQWGVLEGQRQLVGRLLHAPDGMIAATALEHGLTLVTRNVKDFAELGVTIVNPWDAA